jgi:hypothetical protein
MVLIIIYVTLPKDKHSQNNLKSLEASFKTLPLRSSDLAESNGNTSLQQNQQG